mmetsp:Transcript_14228/g.43144  ORF Transcript_14228/g.43144 Transcript_14228/m.43144 type:complete len:112 (+) Transcript_14228:141-476(+)
MATWYQSRRARSLRKHRAAYERRDCEAVMREIAYDLSDRDFFRSYRMDKNTFEYILARATPYLMKQKKARWDSLAPDVLLSMTLSWLRCDPRSTTVCGRPSTRSTLLSKMR